MTALRKPVTILLVEDDDADAKAVRRAFKMAHVGNPIRRAVDGLEALEILKGESGVEKLVRPYLLLTDVNMPRLNGVEFIRSIRDDRELHQAVVFMLTTSNREEDRAACYALNVAGYILKETAGPDFAGVVNMLDAYSRVVEMP
jgi:CheY-like chemotaxis protein